jgi:hypothetical protein
MKYIITESQYRKVINEDRFSQLKDASETLENIINNFDNIDCDDEEEFIYDNDYAETYCSQLNDRTIDELIQMKNLMDKEIGYLINKEFRSKIR